MILGLAEAAALAGITAEETERFISSDLTPPLPPRTPLRSPLYPRRRWPEMPRRWSLQRGAARTRLVKARTRLESRAAAAAKGREEGERKGKKEAYAGEIGRAHV